MHVAVGDHALIDKFALREVAGKRDDSEHARETWTKLGKMGFEMDRPAGAHDATQPPQDRA